MAEGVTLNLLFAALSAGLLGFLLCSRDLPVVPSAAIALLKVAIPTAYFAFFFDGTWTFLDDKTYLNHADNMQDDGINPVTALVTQPGLDELLSRGSQHYLYDWWNLLAVSLFGEHYYAPVFLNVFLTFVGGYFLVRLVRLAGFGQGYARILLVFFLFHWEVLAWSSLVNVKDTLVMTLTIMALYFVLKLSKRVTPWSLLALGALFLVFATLRLYVPILITMAVVAWGLLYVPGRRKYLLISASALGMGVVFVFLGMSGGVGPDVFLRKLDVLSPVSAVPGTVVMALTPRPWALNEPYSFLLLPSILHWTLFLPAIVGGWLLWRHSKEAALLIIYLALVLLLYGAYPDYQSPRFRVQATFVIVWMQFHFFWVILPKVVERIGPARKSARVQERQ